VSIGYRREIDGLRAIALLPVTLFHMGFAAFGGGFIGVDVFYVISGYLITTVIVTEKRSGTFSIARFYERRARRILPALLLVAIACIPFGWIWMLPDDFENFGESLVATAIFANNILLWLTSGYFQAPVEVKPLAHTWSLAIEEQYYVGFPILIALLWRVGKRGLLAALMAIGIASLAAAQLASTIDANANYLLLPTRVWELLIGSFVALHLLDGQRDAAQHRMSRFFADCASILGLLLIAVSASAFDRTTPFPGLNALLPTLGSAIVILFATRDTFVGRTLGSNVLVKIGLISYSAYLWQQPLFAFARIRSLEEPSALMMGTLAATALAFAYLSWRLIERPFRDRSVIPTRAFVRMALGGSIVVAGTGMLIYLSSGFVHRWPELNTGIDGPGRRLNAIYNEVPLKFRNRTFDDTGSAKVLVLGNSFARDFINAGVEAGNLAKASISYSDVVPACIRGASDLDAGLRSLIAESDYAIFVGIEPKCWRSDEAIYRQVGARRIAVIGPKNFGWNMNAVMLLEPGERYVYRAKVMSRTLRENEQLRQVVLPTQYVDILETLIDGDGRVAVFTEDRKLISQDGDHLTKSGARYLGARIFQHPLFSGLR
jgi:peptidoglycan/LPS O-acetylase OafA/YrhL